MAKPDLGPLEYWLLDVVAEFAVPLRVLRTGEVELALNRPSLGASNADLARSLAVLLDLGFATADILRDGRRPLVDDIDLALAPHVVRGRHEANYYRMTAAGGAEWERRAKPDWNRYIEYRTAPSGAGWDEITGWEHSIICADAALAERYLAYQRAVWLKPDAVHGDSTTRDVLRPWEATYWKELSEAHRIRFSTRPEPNRYPSADDLARSEFPHGDARWHDDPWEGVG